MKKSLIFLSVFVVACLAFFDAKGRIEELDEVSANTPSQVEMKTNPAFDMKKNNNITDIKPQDNTKKLHENINQNNTMNNNFDRINERRKNISAPGGQY